MWPRLHSIPHSLWFSAWPIYRACIYSYLFRCNRLKRAQFSVCCPSRPLLKNDEADFGKKLLGPRCRRKYHGLAWYLRIGSRFGKSPSSFFLAKGQRFVHKKLQVHPAFHGRVYSVRVRFFLKASALEVVT